MSRIRLEGALKRGNNITWREFGVEGVLLDLHSGEYFQLDDVGLMIWMQIDGRKTAARIVQEIISHFDADTGILAADTIEFLEDLLSKGLISVEP